MLNVLGNSSEATGAGVANLHAIRMLEISHMQEMD